MAENWEAVLTQAMQCLSRSCQQFAEKLESREAGVKELRELTAAMKELSALRKSLQSEGKDSGPTVEVSFDDVGENWSK